MLRSKPGQKSSTHTLPDNTLIVIQKNDRIKEQHRREMSKLSSDEQRTSNNREKLICDIQNEIRDMRAYTVVYRENSLSFMERRQRPPDYMQSLKQQVEKTAETLSDISKRQSDKPKRQLKDPFRLRECLKDVEMDDSERPANTKAIQANMSANTALISPRALLRSALTLIPRKDHQSLLPGDCTSYYSIRRYYEQEKDKLLSRWGPEVRRKQTVKWIMEHLKSPQFSINTRKTTSAIFREFRRCRSHSFIAEQESKINDTHSPFEETEDTQLSNESRQRETEHLMLPDINQSEKVG